jgi:ribosomal protein S18 acetylase RimI-like enzyme
MPRVSEAHESLTEQGTLDHPVWAALTGPHAGLAERRGAAARYPEAMSPFAAVEPSAGGDAWSDLGALVASDGSAVLVGDDVTPPEGWTVLGAAQGVQMVDVSPARAPSEEINPTHLGPDDVPAMLELVARTRPGPFLPRTHELGTYLGVRERGALVAMAGQRLHPAGWTEISAVCTDPASRGRGLASALVSHLRTEITSRGETPFLHAAASNVSAIRLYESLGFVLRRRIVFTAVRPANPGPG